MFPAHYEWFLYLGISCTIHLRAKQDGCPFCFSYGRSKLFRINEAVMPHNTKNATKFGNKVFRDICFSYFFSNEFTQGVFKTFCLQMTNGRQGNVPQNFFQNLKRYPCKNNYARYMLKQLFTYTIHQQFGE